MSEKDTTCVICLDPGADDMAPVIKCRCTRLTVHFKCLGTWFSNHTACPVCRCVVGKSGPSSRIEGPDGIIVGPLPPSTPVTFIRFSALTQEVLYSSAVDSSHPSIDLWHTVFSDPDLALWTEDDALSFDRHDVVKLRMSNGTIVPAWKMMLARLSTAQAMH